MSNKEVWKQMQAANASRLQREETERNRREEEWRNKEQKEKDRENKKKDKIEAGLLIIKDQLEVVADQSGIKEEADEVRIVRDKNFWKLMWGKFTGFTPAEEKMIDEINELRWVVWDGRKKTLKDAEGQLERNNALLQRYPETIIGYNYKWFAIGKPYDSIELERIMGDTSRLRDDIMKFRFNSDFAFCVTRGYGIRDLVEIDALLANPELAYPLISRGLERPNSETEIYKKAGPFLYDASEPPLPSNDGP